MHPLPPPQAWGEGGGKHFRKVFAGGGGGVENFILVGGNFVWGRSRNFEVKVKTA